jgi:hypothetical protein
MYWCKPLTLIRICSTILVKEFGWKVFKEDGENGDLKIILLR